MSVNASIESECDSKPRHLPDLHVKELINEHVPRKSTFASDNDLKRKERHKNSHQCLVLQVRHYYITAQTFITWPAVPSLPQLSFMCCSTSANGVNAIGADD